MRRLQSKNQTILRSGPVALLMLTRTIGAWAQKFLPFLQAESGSTAT